VKRSLVVRFIVSTLMVIRIGAQPAVGDRHGSAISAAGRTLRLRHWAAYRRETGERQSAALESVLTERGGQVKWILVVLLVVQAHFAASCLVPLRSEDQGALGGLLRWVWPWADGDHGPLGTMVADGESPLAGILLALTTATVFIVAALAVAGLWVPPAWWRPLAIAGAVLLLGLMTLFFGPTKLVPIVVALGTLYIALARPDQVAPG
jgi:hypothetical protein